MSAVSVEMQRGKNDVRVGGMMRILEVLEVKGAFVFPG